MYVNFCFFLGTTCVLMCGLCVLFYCVCNYALLLCCCCCCFYFVCFLCFERVIAFRWENMPKNGTKYALVLLFFFCTSEWLFVCACVCGWVCKLILVILIDLLQAGFCFLAITKSHINKIIKAAKRRTISVGSGSAVGVEESAARRLCSFLCVCVWVCKAKGKTEKTKPNMCLCVCVCIYLLLLLRRMAHSKSEISTRISL